MTQTDAESALASAGFVVGNIAEVFDGATAAGTACRTNPASGTLFPAGSEIGLCLSLGPETGTDTTPPIVAVSVDPEKIQLGETVTVAWSATDNAGLSQTALTINGETVSTSPGEFTHTAENYGPCTIVATATDAAGQTSAEEMFFVVVDPTDTEPPVVTLDQNDVFEVTDLTAITGSITDNVGFTYELQCREIGMTEWLTMHEGAGVSITGDLGTFDPTVLRNGVHEIRVIAEDPAGNVGRAQTCAIVDGGMKIGQLEFGVGDLSSPQLGFPLALERKYDSRMRGAGDFGPGWTLPSSDVKAQMTVPLGKGWAEQQGAGAFGIPTYFLMELRQHIVVIRFSDEEVLKFKMEVAPKKSLVIPIGQYNLAARFVPLGKTKGTLEALGFSSNTLMLVNGSLYEYGSELYDPKRFRYTRLDGTQFVIHTENGIESITDVYGHKLTYDEAGITHSSGAGIEFTRGAGNRIERVKDYFGNEVEYRYDADGNLEKAVLSNVESPFTRMLGNYHSVRGLIGKPEIREIRAPDGTVLGAFEYDKKGRVTAMTDANGERLIYGFDTERHRQTVTNRRGFETVYDYDGRGNVTKKADPLGNVEEWEFDDRDNNTVEKLTDADGNLLSHKTFEYDENDNKIFEHVHIASENRRLTTGRTYNERGQVLTVTDPKGMVTTYTYDENGELESIMEPGGRATVNTYDANGNIASMQIGGYAPTVYTYYNDGNIRTETDPLGNTIEYTYWPGGNVETETKTRTDEGAVVSAMTRYEYDLEKRLTKTVDPHLNEEVTEYNDIGKKAFTIDKNGNRTDYEYDPAGNLEQVGYADGSFERYTYDGEGNKLTFTDRDGNTAGYEYDALNRLTGTYYCGEAETCTEDNAIHRTGTEYDGAGRVTAQIDENGARTEYEYDDAGRRTVVRRLLDGEAIEIRTTYDDNGNRRTVTDPAGHVTTYEYDAGNRKVKTIFDDDSFIEVEYDGRGRKKIEYSQCLPGNESQRVKTKYLYDASGKLTGVINDFEGPDQIETAYDYDEAGNKTAQTVPNRNTTRWAYDDLGRVSKKTLPEMMSEHFTYFPNGNLETKTDFNGDTTTYGYHPCCGRLESKTYPDGTSVSYTYTNTGRVDEVTDARGVTDHDYNFRGRLISVSNPDGTALSYTYRPNGNRETVTANPSGKTTTYRYDDLNRLEYVIDPDNRQTMYTYDDAGNRKTVAYPNGVMTEYTYDDLNRLEYMENRLLGEIISSYDYVLRDDGNRTDVYEHNGREVHYTYDRLNRLTEEYIIDPSNGEERINYTYDAFGNRATKTDSTGTTVYKYDANDRLLFEIGPEKTISYKYDANGNTIEKSDGFDTTVYTYDFENRLVSAQTPDGLVAYEYDHDGIKVSSSVDGNVTRYLVDKNRRYAQVMEERDNAGTLVVSYVYGDDLISQNRGGSVSFYEYDGQLSTRHLTDISGNVTDSYVYDAFGVLTAKSGVTDNNYLYTGESYDPNAGFYYLRARWMNQDVGRFMTQDPLTTVKSCFVSTSSPGYFPVKNVQIINKILADYRNKITIRNLPNINLYLYVNSNPINKHDPSGMMEITLGDLFAKMSGDAILRAAKAALLQTSVVTVAVAVTAYIALEAANYAHCLRLYLRCDDEQWRGNCATCFRYCLVQEEWDFLNCPPN